MFCSQLNRVKDLDSTEQSLVNLACWFIHLHVIWFCELYSQLCYGFPALLRPRSTSQRSRQTISSWVVLCECCSSCIITLLWSQIRHCTVTSLITADYIDVPGWWTVARARWALPWETATLCWGTWRQHRVWRDVGLCRGPSLHCGSLPGVPQLQSAEVKSSLISTENDPTQTHCGTCCSFHSQISL